MKNHRLFIRNFDAGIFLEIFLISAVLAILLIRLFLKLTGYPQLGGSSLHIAHMLWGGLFMAIALLIMLSFLSKTSDRIGAILGGIGFGTFIDEVGKFITQNNDYFFQPSVSLMYIFFILIFVFIRNIHTRRKNTSKEYLMNALKEMEEVVLHDLDRKEKIRALRYLSRCNPRDPMVRALKIMIESVDLVPTAKIGYYSKLKKFFREKYKWIAAKKWFYHALILFFIFQLTVKLIYAFVLIFIIGLGWTRPENFRFINRIAVNMKNLSFVQWGQLISSLLSGVFVFIGIFHIPKNRLKALQMFRKSILISIFITQIFTFYHEEFGALLGLLFNICILLALQYIINQES